MNIIYRQAVTAASNTNEVNHKYRNNMYLIKKIKI